MAVRGRGDAQGRRAAASGRAGRHLRPARAEAAREDGKADAKLLRELLAAGRVPECYIPPSQVLEWRALLELYHDLRVAHTGWAKRIHATCFHQGTTALGEAGVVRGSRQRLESIVAEQLSPVGRLQVTPRCP